MKIMQKLLITYLITFCIPLSVLLYMYYNQVQNNLTSNYISAQQQTATRAYNIYRENLNSIQSFTIMLNQNTSFCDFVDGKYSLDSERVYTYMVSISPQIKYALATNRLLSDVQIYKLNDNFKIPPYYFIDRWSNDALSLDDILATVTPLHNQWQLTAKPGLDSRLCCYATLYDSSYRRKIAVLNIKINPSMFFKDLLIDDQNTSIVLESNNQFYNLSKTGELSSASGKYLEEIKASSDANQTNTIHNSKRILIHSLSLPDVSAKMYFVTELSIFSQNEIYILLLPIIILLVLITSIYFITFFSGTTRILKLEKHLRNADHNDLKLYTDNRYFDEIGTLVNSYNMLIDNINRLINNVYTAEIKSREAQYYALQAQVNPHFMLNTLENIRMMAQINSDFQTAQMISILGRMFQYNINKDNIFSTYHDELVHAENYLTLCMMRIGDKLTYNISPFDAVSSIQCPRNIVQPIVENSITHAFVNHNQTMHINITVVLDNNDVMISISDNGVGIPEKKLERLNQSLHSDNSEPSNKTRNSVGLVNVHQRLKLFYGEDCGLKIYNRPEGGLTCELRLRAKTM